MVHARQERYDLMVISDFAYADVAFDGYRAAEFPGVAGAARRGRGVHHDEQGLQHGRLAGRLLRRQRRDDARASGPPSRATTTTACFRRSRWLPSSPCEIPKLAVETAERAVYQARRDVLCEGLTRIGWQIPPRPRLRHVCMGAKIPEPWASQMGSIDRSP